MAGTHSSDKSAAIAAQNGFAQEDSVGAPAGEGAAQPAQTSNIETIMRIPVTVKIVIGTATMPVAQLLKLGRGAVIPLDRRVGEPVDVVVNGHAVARGEIVVIEEDGSRFGISLTEVIARDSRRGSG